MRTGFRSVFFTLLLLALAGCGKSEVDKCVESYMKTFEVVCSSSNPPESLCQKGSRENEEYKSRIRCMKAAAGKD